MPRFLKYFITMFTKNVFYHVHTLIILGALNPYRAPFLDGNSIIAAANEIDLNHF